MTLSIQHFQEFFADVHGRTPFAWQVALAERVLSGVWPEVIDLPTAAGKTASIDVAIFALAAAAVAKKPAPRRVFFVVDRRVVVDEAYDRARRIAAALEEPKSPIVTRVRDALASLGGEWPLRVSRLRGGVAPDDAWARTPCQPLVCCSTVDQIGSRLLFRAYGRVRRFGWSIPAGLVGTDSLIILDEAHLSAAFAQTLSLASEYGKHREVPSGLPVQVVQMSATARSSAPERRFAPGPELLREQPLRERFEMNKWARIETVKVPKDPTKDDRGDKAAKFAMELGQPGEVVGVVLNRVDRARSAFKYLKSKKEANDQLLLLTGRTRSIDRDELLAKWWDRIKAGRLPSAPGSPRCFVVATQCIEAGADIDLDRLVTDSASLDAIRQRFGRLCRLGRGDSGTTEAGDRAVILVGGGESDDPVYGTSLGAFNEWVQRQATGGRINVGVEALAPQLPAGDELVAMCSPVGYQPVLLPAHLDLLAQTSTQRAVDADIAPFLHGPSRGPADITLVWRGDLGDDESQWASRVVMAPPTAAEGLSLAPWTVSKWSATLSDAEGEREPDAKADRAPTKSLRCLLWRGRRESEPIHLASARPGDVLILPSSAGGCDEFGWNPESEAEVSDRADEAWFRAGRGIRIRCDRLPGEPDLALPVTDDETATTFLRSLVAAAGNRAELAGEALKFPNPPLLAWGDETERIAAILPDSPSERMASAEQAESHTTDGEEAEYTTGITLAAHSRDVGTLAAKFAASCGLSAKLVEDIGLAAWLHDAGKADPRFQVLMYGGDSVGAEIGPVLAKSLTGSTHLGRERAKRAAGYPEGGRHELLSIRIAEASKALSAAHDKALVLHLVGSHHGRCRPFAPMVIDDSPQPVDCEILVGHGSERLLVKSDTGLGRLDSGVADRYWALTKRYGWWGLAFLEGILRLADHRASEIESTGSST